ncbi:MAG: CotH kinase family protein [Desulfobacterales bacterium]|nr:CotH kinase family protein [Desulfobacterales bacterium]
MNFKLWLYRLLVFGLVHLMWVDTLVCMELSAFYNEALSISPVFTWRDSSTNLRAYQCRLYKGNCVSTNCLDNPMRLWFQTKDTRFALDYAMCPNWDCTLQVDKINNQGVIEEITKAYPINFQTSLPIVILKSDASISIDAGDESKSISLQLIRSDSQENTLEYSGTVTINPIQNEKTTFPKKEYEIVLENPVSLLTMPEGNQWYLLGGWLDRSLIRSKLTLDLFSQMSPENNFGPQSRFVEVFLNHDYLGIFLLAEAVNEQTLQRQYHLDMTDILFDNPFVVTLIQSPYQSGGIYDYFDQECGFPKTSQINTMDAVYDPIYPDWDRLSQWMAFHVVGFLSGLHRSSCLDLSTMDMNSGIFTYLDWDSAIDFILLQELTFKQEAYQSHFKLVRPTQSAIRLIPWDYERGYGNEQFITNICDPNTNDLSVVSEGFAHRPPLFYRLLRVPQFYNALVARWEQLRADGGLLSSDSIYHLIDVLVLENPVNTIYGKTLQTDSIYRNFMRWPIHDPAYTDQTLIQQGFCVHSSEDFQTEIQRLKDWIVARLNYLDNHWSGLLDQAYKDDLSW